MSASDYAAWWGAATGTASAGLLAARFAWDRNGDKRAIRLELRKELRAMTVGAQEELSQARTCATVGKEVGDVGQYVEQCKGDNGLRPTMERIIGIGKNPNVVFLPRRRELWRVVNDSALAIDRAEHAWLLLSMTEAMADAAKVNRLGVSQSEFLRRADPAIDGCKKLIKTLNAFDA